MLIFFAMKDYPRFLTPELEPFHPLELAKATEEIVCRGDQRKYTEFYPTGVYGGIATGYTCGCCLRCIFCWVDLSREFPESYGQFYSPQQAFQRLREAAKRHRVGKARISGAEPALGREHLIPLLRLVEESSFSLFILETNGILFGADPDYVKEVSQFEKVHTRISLKAGTPEGFTKKTGAKPEAFALPFQAIQSFLRQGASFHVASMSADPRFMEEEERESLLHRLQEIDPRLIGQLEEEVVDPYRTTLLRLRHAGHPAFSEESNERHKKMR
ncbi:MAG: radical SAM protein [candidate division NC10 bacterium]|nr:radical SAM protein [candidate division NC10 bacterium]